MTPEHTNCDTSPSHVDLRDTFAAAALTGLLARGGIHYTGTPDDNVREMYQWADAMLREREKAVVSDTNHDAVPEAKAAEPESPVPLRSGAAPANAQEPVAWAVRKWNPPVGELPAVCWTETEMRYEENRNLRCTVIPLYRSPTLTDEEREAVQLCETLVSTLSGIARERGLTSDADNCADDKLAATLRSLLERLQ